METGIFKWLVVHLLDQFVWQYGPCSIRSKWKPENTRYVFVNMIRVNNDLYMKIPDKVCVCWCY